VILKHILKNIWENKFRSALIIIALTLSAMVMFLNLTFKDDMNARYKAMIMGASQEYDLAVSKDVSTDDVYFEDASLSFSGLPVENKLPMLHAYGLMDTAEEGVKVSLLGADRQLMIDTGLCVLPKDTGFDANSDNQVITNKKTAEAYELAPGDSVTITTSWGEEKFTVAAIAENKGLYLNTGDSILFMMSKDYLEEKMGRAGMSDSLWIDLKDGSKTKTSMETFEAANTGFKTAALLDEEAIRDGVTMFNQLILIILMMVAILTFYVVSSITRLLLAIRIPVVGTFRSVGATKHRVNGILFLENAVYGLFGGTLGIIMGLLARGAVASAFLGTSQPMTGKASSGFNPLYIVGVIGFSILLQLLITASTIFKVGRMPIKDTIFNVQNVKQRVSNRKSILGVVLLIASFVIYRINMKYSLPVAVLAFVSAIVGAVFLVPLCTRILSRGLAFISQKLFGNAAELGCKNISYSKSITSSVILAMVALSLLLSVYMLTLSINTIFDKAENIFESDIQISNPSKSYEEYEKLTDIEGVDKIDFLFFYFGSAESNGQTVNLVVAGMDEAREGIRETGYRLDTLKDDEMLMDEYYAVRNDIVVGDQVFVPEKNLSFKVVGFMDASQFSANRSVCVINESYFIKHFSDIPVFIGVYTSQNIDDMKKILKEEFAGENVMIQTSVEYFAIQRANVSGIVSLTVLVTIISVLLAVVGLVNNQMIGFIQRKREYVILYSVSMSRAQLRIMMFFEVLGTFVIGVLLGTILSFWLITLLEGLMFSIGMYMPMEYDLLPVFGVAAVIFLFLMLTALPPMRRLAKINVVNEIKYE